MNIIVDMHACPCIYPTYFSAVPECKMKHASHVGHMSVFADYRFMIYASEQTVMGQLDNVYAGHCFAKVSDGFKH